MIFDFGNEIETVQRLIFEKIENSKQNIEES